MCWRSSLTALEHASSRTDALPAESGGKQGMGHSIVNEEQPVESIPERPLWGENYVLTFYDRSADIGSLLSMGRWVLQPRVWRNMSYIALPNDRVLISRNYGRSANPNIADSGVFQLEVLEPGKRLRYVFDGPIEERTQTDLNTGGYRIGQNSPLCFDLIFESDQPIWDMHSSGLHAETENAAANFNSPEGHIEQHGRVSGTIEYAAGESYRLQDVPATRDHSRGTRNFTRYKGHIWGNGIFPSGRAFHLFTLKTHGFDGVATGRAAAVVDGELHDIELALDTGGWLDRPRQLFDPFKMRFHSRKFGDFDVEALELRSSVPLALTMPADHYWSVPTGSRVKNMTWVNEQKIIWCWDGEEGCGHIERGNSTFSSTDRAWLENFR
jgi:hypothetical protein